MFFEVVFGSLCGLVACEGCKGGKLGGTFVQRHGFVALGHVVRQVNDVIVLVVADGWVLVHVCRVLCFVAANLLVALFGCGTLFKIGTFEDGVFAIFFFDAYKRFLHAALFL